MQAHGVEDGTIPNEKLSASSVRQSANWINYDWPFRGRLNHNGGTLAWGPYNHPTYGQKDNWFQVIIIITIIIIIIIIIILRGTTVKYVTLQQFASVGL